MIKITFTNGTILETESFIVNEDSIKLIKSIKPVKNQSEQSHNYQTKAAIKGLKNTDKRPSVNFKLSEENRMRICKLWFNSIVTDINVLADEYGLRYQSIREVLKTRGVKYGYINSSKLWPQERKLWWNNTEKTISTNKKSLVLNK